MNLLGGVTDYVLRLANLMEAEGRTAKRNAVRLGWTICLMIAVLCLGIGGAVMVLIGVHDLLVLATHPIAAIMLSGVVTWIAAAGVYWFAQRIENDEPRPIPGKD